MENSKRFMVQFSEAARGEFARTKLGKKDLIACIAYKCEAAFLAMSPASWIPVIISFSLDKSVQIDLNDKQLKCVFKISQDALAIKTKRGDPWPQKTDAEFIKDRLNEYLSIDLNFNSPKTYVTHVKPV
jgi:hypothetical protein